MKNTRKTPLRKVLVAIMIAAMLVTSIVTVAMAASNTSYEGSLNTAQSYLKKATEPESTVLPKDLNDYVSQKLAVVYAYVTNPATLIDPSTKGYGDFVDLYNKTTFELALKIYEPVKTSSNVNERSEALVKLYKHMAGAPIFDRDDCEITVGGTTHKYSEFVAEYKRVNLDITNLLIDALFGTTNISKDDGKITASAVNYNDYLIIYKAFRNYLDNVKQLEYVAPVSDIYTGSVSVVEAKLGTLTAKSNLTAYTKVIGEIYTYMCNTPIDPTSDAYAVFYAKYVSACEKLMSLLSENVDAALGVDAKISVMRSFRDFLNATPISAEVVSAFNARVAVLIADYNGANETLREAGDLSADESIVPAPAYTGDITAFAAIIADVSVNSTPENLSVAVVNAYNYLKNTPVNPASAGYAEQIAKYTELRNALVDEIFKRVDEAESFSDKTSLLVVNVKSMLEDVPLSESAIDRYNAKLEEIAGLVDADIATIQAMGVAFSNPAALPTADADMLTLLMSRISGAKNLEEKKSAFTSMYSYIVSTNVAGASNYSAILAEYSQERSDFVTKLLAGVVDKASAELVSAYLSAAPVSASAVEAFNTKLDELVTASVLTESERDSLEVSCFVLEMKKAKDDFAQASTFAEKKALYATVYELYRYGKIDATDNSALSEASDAMQAVVTGFENAISEYIDATEAPAAKIASLNEVREFIILNPLSTTYTTFNEVLNDVISEYEAALADLKDEGNRLGSVNAEMKKMISAVNNAKTLEEKKAALSALYTYKLNAYLDPSDSADVVALYNKMCNSFTSELMASVNLPTLEDQISKLLEIKAFISANPYSIGAVAAYNEAYNTIKSGDYSSMAEAVEAALTGNNAAVFTAPAGFATDFTELKALVDALGTPTADTLKAVFTYLENNKLDFTNNAEFLPALKAFSAAKTSVWNKFSSDINAVLGTDILTAFKNGTLDTVLNSYKNAFAGPYNYLSANCMSYSMVESYNNKFKDVSTSANSFYALHEAALERFEAYTKALHTHISGCPLEESVVGKEAVENINSRVDGFNFYELSGLVARFEIVPLTAKELPIGILTGAYGKISAFMKQHPVSDDYLEGNGAKLNAAAKAAIAKAEARIEEEKVNLDANAPLGEYGNSEPLYFYDFNDNKFSNTCHHTDTCKICSMYTKDGTLVFQGGTKYENPSSHYEGQYPCGAWAHYFEFSMPNTSFVLEYDFQVPDEDNTIWIMHSVNWDGEYCSFANIWNNMVREKDGAAATTMDDKWVPGEWVHFTWEVNLEECTSKFYINYEFYVEYNLKEELSGKAIKTLRTFFDFQDFSNEKATIDNFLVYEGTHFRIMDKIDKMNDKEKFNYYVSQFMNESLSFQNRSSAYNYASVLAESVKDIPECAASYEIFANFDFEKELFAIANEYNINYLNEGLDSVSDIKMQNASIVLEKLIELEKYIESNTSFIDVTADAYFAVRDRISAYREEANLKLNVYTLIGYMKQFDRTNSYRYMVKYLGDASGIYKLCRLDDAEVYDSLKNDSYLKSFLRSVESGSTTLMEYYEYMCYTVAEEALRDNSRTIVYAMDIIKGLEGYADAVDEATKTAFWNKNFDAIENQLVKVRLIINNYSNNYDGIDEAVKMFNELNGYFYPILQKKHISVFEEQLAKYTATNSYIEKKGVCSYLAAYVAENDIDEENEELKPLLKLFSIYTEEVEKLKDSYTALLEQNTKTFIATINEINAHINDFAEVVRLMDEINNNYYYNMNVDVLDNPELKAELERALAGYDTINAHISEVQNATNMFINYAANLRRATKRKDIYDNLVKCAAYIDKADADAATGFAAALEVYNTKLAEYIAEYSTANDCVEDANSVVCATRSLSIAETVLSVLKNIFSK